MSTEDNNQVRPFLGMPFTFSNNVSVGTTLTEAVLTFSIGTIPTNVIYLSLPVAKHLVGLLSNTLAEYENKMGEEIMSVEEIYQQQLKSASNDKEPNSEE